MSRVARTVATLLLAAGLLYAALVALVWWQQDRMIFPGAGRGDRGVPALATPVAVSWLDGESRTRLATIEVAAPRAVALYFGGNGEDLFASTYTAAELAAHGLEAIACEYPGFGASPGRPSAKNVLATALAVAAHARARARALGVPLVVVGSSLGSFAAVHAAAAGHADRLVLRAPPTSIAAIARAGFWWLPVGTLLAHRFDNLEAAPRVACPVLVLHGDRDRIVPTGHGRALADAIRGARFVAVPGCGHDDLSLRPGTAGGESLRAFLAGN